VSLVQGWKFWPDRPKGPVDEAYVQHRFVRPYGPGPLRWVIAIAGAAVTAFTAFAALLLVYTSSNLVDLLVSGVLALAVVLAVGTLTARFGMAGVWVNDAGVRAVTVLRSRTWAWRQVADVRLAASRTTGRRTLLLVLTDGSDVTLPLVEHGLDFLGRAEAFDIATTAVERWWRGSRPTPTVP
jgi:hypothetical protein